SESMSSLPETVRSTEYATCRSRRVSFDTERIMNGGPSRPRTTEETMLDMLIQGGRVVTPAGAGDWDVGVVGEKIVCVAFPGVLPAEVSRVIDARGKIVVPGGIETHAHAVANVQP